jgi:DNA polymerase
MYIPKYENMGKVPTITHEGQNPYTKKWGRLKLIPGRLTENCVQGTAREMMAQGLLNVKANLPQVKLVATVHDEAIGRTPIGKTGIEDFNKELCSIPWAEDCPITAEGWLGQRYKK